MLKIQMKAATLMNSGTVTKKPAMKLRRSQSMRLQPARSDRREDGQPQSDSIPGKRRKPRASDEQQERRDDGQRGDKGRDKADADVERACRRELMADFEEFVRKC